MTETLRDRLNREKRKRAFIIYCGMAVFFAGSALASVFKPAIALAVIGFFVSFVTIGSMYFWFVCPECHGNIGSAAISGGPFSFSRKMRYCPAGGEALDERDQHAA